MSMLLKFMAFVGIFIIRMCVILCSHTLSIVLSRNWLVMDVEDVL